MKKNSFTLIEMLVVIAIIGILAAMVIPVTGMARDRARMTDCTNNKGQLMKAMIVYSGDNKGVFIYRGECNGTNRTYADVLSGLDGKVKQYASGDLMMCASAKHDLNADATNATGMLNAINMDKLTGNADPSQGWLNSDSASNDKFYKRFGRFASSRNKNTIVYDSERFKGSASQLLIFADTFKRKGGTDDTYWNFTPNGPSGGSDDSGYYVTLVHGSQTVGAFADGHAEGMEAGRLKDCGTEVKKYNDSDFIAGK